MSILLRQRLVLRGLVLQHAGQPLGAYRRFDGHLAPQQSLAAGGITWPEVRNFRLHGFYCSLDFCWSVRLSLHLW
jgi:hypothetical protein